MKVFWLLICVLNIVCCKKERLSDLYEMLKNPDFMQEIEKRISSLDDDVDLFSDNRVGCYDNSGLLESGCSFHVNGSAIIKTDESLQRGAEFLDDFVNVSCPRDCTSLCCKNKDCDTAVYQDKGDRKCYLFRCGDSSSCVFSHHSNYSVSSISKAAYKSHSYSPGGATHSHENELENLGSHSKERTSTPAPVSSTTVTTVAHARMKLPELGEYCTSYLSRCEDPHAECMRQTCQCRVGYHNKHDMCRKHCRDEEFECEKVYDADSRQCILSRYVCDGHRDCSDGSDEENCPDKSKEEEKPSRTRPLDSGSKNGIFQFHPDKPKNTDIPSTTHKTTENIEVHQTTTTPRPVTPKPTDGGPQVPSDMEKADVPNIDNDKQASADTDPKDTQEPVSSEQEAGDQSVDESSSGNSGDTEEKGEKTEKGYLEILNADAVEVESYTDSSQGPIVALALGLAITMILLIFVGCRLRTVKRRLRKGRALHSNEADYLINGMYL